MRTISVIILTLPDGKVVLQRRSADAPIAPGLLGFFGGHVEAGETHRQAMVRELAEETSLDPSALTIKHLQDSTFYVPSIKEQVAYHIYTAQIAEASFEVYEGDRAETYTIKEALARSDLTLSVRHILSDREESNGTRSN